jgi:geranylgeranyl diphosphate synthase type I
MSPEKHKKASEIVVEVLKKKSKKGLEFAKKTILAENIECKKLREALEYYILNWTDFTHPGLFSIACEAVGGNPDKAVQVQAGISLMSAAFDIHDDIIDKSKIKKHGKSTVFGKFGKDITLLLGNAFLVKGFILLGKSIRELPQNKVEEIFETLKKSLFEIGNAHALELNLKGKINVIPEEYMKILEMKAASVETDMRIGAIIGGGTNSEVEALTRYGRILGILATLREEFIDVFEIEELSHRIHSECLPIPVLYAIQDRDSKQRIQKLLAKKQVTSKDVDEILDIVFEAKAVRKLEKMMKDLIEETTHLVSEIKDKQLKALLVNFTESTLEDL